MIKLMIRSIKHIVQRLIALFLNYPIILSSEVKGYSLVKSERANANVSENSSICHPYSLRNVDIGDYTYIAKNCNINNAVIGKFCSVGPNFCCAMGIHPINGISTSPMFYSTAKQNGFSMVSENKVLEYCNVFIGNDVFIGVNVTVIDGVSIGNGAVIGAGSVVTKDVPPYAVIGGVPAKIIKFRYSDENIKKLLEIAWWNFSSDRLKDVEKCFFDIELFISLNTD